MKIRNKKTGEIIEITEDQLADYGLPSMKKGGLIKRADCSYSKRGLWDNIRANKGSGKKPTKEMLKQEKKIKAAEKKNGGGIDNPGFKALPKYVQQNIIENMAIGGYMESGGKLPKEILKPRLEAHMSPSEVNEYLTQYEMGGDVIQAKSGIYIKPENKGKFTATKKRTGKTTEQLTHSKNPLTRKRAIFAQNAKKWKHGKKEIGGFADSALVEKEQYALGGYYNPDMTHLYQDPDYMYQIGGITTPYGQWEYPGMITTIPSNNITMRDVPYPVLGVSDTGHMQLMQPNKDYKFKGNKVTEFPIAQTGLKTGIPYRTDRPIVLSSDFNQQLNADNQPLTPTQIFQLSAQENELYDENQPAPIVNELPVFNTSNKSQVPIKKGKNIFHNEDLTKYKLPKFNIYGNRYAKLAGQELDNAMNFAMNIYKEYPQKATSQKYNIEEMKPLNIPQITENSNSGVQFQSKRNGGIKIAQNGDYYQGTIDNTNPINENYNINPSAIVGTAASLGQAAIRGTQSVLDTVGTNMQEQREKQRNAAMFAPSLASQAMNTTPYETQGFGFSGRNPVGEYGGLVEAKELGGYFRKKTKPASKLKKNKK